jgi:prolyl oligopeptidase
MIYPHAEPQPVVDHLHGHLVHDPYRWLEDPTSPETQKWLAAQDDLWRRHAAELPGRDRLHARVAELSDTGLITAPMWCGERQFFLRQGAQQEHPALYITRPDGVEEVLVDPMALDPQGSITLDRWQPDREGRLLAYQLSGSGDERSELYVLDVDTRRIVDGPIDRCRYSTVAWLPGGEAFFYVRAVPGQVTYPRRIYLHQVGTPAVCDVDIFGSGRHENTSYGLGMSQDGRWLVISASQAPLPYNDLWLADLSTSSPAEPDLRVVQKDLNAQSVLHVGADERIYILTILGSPRGRLCVGDPAHPEHDNWRDLIPEDPEAVLSNFTILDGQDLQQPVLLVVWIRHAISEISVHDLATGKRLGDVPLPGLGSIGSLTAHPTGGHEAWFTYTDSVNPVAVHRYDARTGQTTLWATATDTAAVSDVDAHLITVTSPDGTPIRMVVLAQPGAATGPRPTILYGYGGFGVPLSPTYSSYILAWVEAGGVFATANLRGGGEYGEEWHRAGMLDRKQNVFDDFIAAAEKLIDDGWTTPGQLGICGESNGGLLVGAALTQRPDLFAAVVCSKPLLDMVRYEKSGLGATWRGEYGSASDPHQLRWLLSYSPYHHVREGINYPAVLFTVFGGDSRVDPLHADKMCAALQAATASTQPILIRQEDNVGHGARAASRAVALAADMLAFFAAHTRLNIKTLPSPPMIHADTSSGARHSATNGSDAT